MMLVLNDSGLAQSSLSPKKCKKARRIINERFGQVLGTSVICMTRNYQLQHLLNRTPNGADSGPVFLLANILFPMLVKPISDKRLDTIRQFVPVVRSTAFCKLSELHQNWNTAKHIPGCVASLVQPGDVLLNRLADPRSTDAVDRIGSDEITLQHDNLLPEFREGDHRS